MRSVKAENVSPIAGVPPANEVKYGYVFYLHSARRVGIWRMPRRDTHVWDIWKSSDIVKSVEPKDQL